MASHPTLKAHPLCLLFPPLPADELAALAADIRAHGLRETITMHEGQVLDGANRLKACQLADVEPQFVDLPSEADPLAFVIGRNVTRRHLSVAQRALIGARLATLGEGRPGKTASKKAVSQGGAAQMVGVSRSAVQQAARVVGRGAPELVQAASAGRVSLAKAAQIAEKSLDEQRRLVAEPNAPKAKKTPTSKPSATARSGPAKLGQLNSFAQRIERAIGDEISYALEHEIPNLSGWTRTERVDARDRLCALREKLDRLIAALEEGVDA